MSRDREAHNAWQREYGKTHKGRLIRLRGNARDRAIKKGLPFDLTTDYLAEIFPDDFICPVLGIKMEWGGGRGGGGCATDNSPSLDRFVPELGYVPGNVAIISHKANSMKGNGTVEEHEKLLQWMREVSGSPRSDPEQNEHP